MRESIEWTLFAGTLLMFGIALAGWAVHDLLVHSYLPFPWVP